MVDTPRPAWWQRRSSPGRCSSESLCRLSDVGIHPLSAPGERQRILRRPVDSTSTDGPPRVAICAPSRICPTIFVVQLPYHTEPESLLEVPPSTAGLTQDEGLLGSLALQSRSSSMRRRGYIPWRQRARVQRKKLRPMGSSRCACPPLEPPRALEPPNPGGKRLPKRGVGLRC